MIDCFSKKGVEFANSTLWGTLTSTIIAHPYSLKIPSVSAAIDTAVAELRYGTVGINVWGGMSYPLGVTTWGAFLGHDIYDIQSGTGIVGNMLMLEQPQKTVIRGPFKQRVQPTALLNNFRVFCQKSLNMRLIVRCLHSFAWSAPR